MSAPYSTSYEFLAKVLSMYRYGQETPPEDITSEDIVNNAGADRPAIHVSLDDFLEGPGRFAWISMFELVKKFFDSNNNLVPGEYTKAYLAEDVFGMSSYGYYFEQWRYADDIDDYLIRVFIWNSTATKLNDDLAFIVTNEGDRYIKNVYVENKDDDNFDFESNSFLATLLNPYLKLQVDFSGIGAKVDLKIDKIGVIHKVGRYDVLSYQSEVDSYDINFKTLSYLDILSKKGELKKSLDNLLNDLWEDDIIKQEDFEGRAIIYGSAKNDSINVNSLLFRAKLNLHDWMYESSLNGFHLIGGNGNDDLQGGAKDDLIRGGDGDDKIAGREGDDILVGGDGADFLRGGAGKDTLYGGPGGDYLDGGAGDDRLFGNDGNDKLLGGAGNDELYGGSVLDSFDGGDGDDLIVAVSDRGGTGDLKGGEGADTFIVGKGTWTIVDAEADDRLFVQVPTGENVAIPILGGYMFRFFWDDPFGSIMQSKRASFRPYKYIGLKEVQLVGDYEYRISYRYLDDGSLHIMVYDGGCGYINNLCKFFGEVYVDVIVKNYRDGVLGLTFMDSLATGGHDGVIEAIREGQETVNRTLSNFMGEPLRFTLDEDYQHIPTPSGWSGGDGGDGAGGSGGSGGTGGTGGGMGGDDGDDWSDPDEAPSDGDDRLKGTNEDDIIDGGDGHDRIRGEEGNDDLKGGKGHDQLDGGPGDDRLDGDFGWDKLNGGEGDDTLTGGGNADLLQGDEGDDTLDGENGQDRLEGGAGNDELHGGADEDRLDGGEGDDKLYGGTQDDILFAGPGQDLLHGENGKDVLYGDNGNDALFGGYDDDQIYGGQGDDLLYGGSQDDLLMGEEGNDRLFGESGNDALLGGPGDDELNGGLNDDIVAGGPGNDTLYGGPQSDSFVYEPGGGADVIKDFQNNVDKLDLRAFGFSSLDEVMENMIPFSGGVRFAFGDGSPITNDVLTIEGMTWQTIQNDIILM